MIALGCEYTDFFLYLQSRSKEKERKDMNVNSFWVYSLDSNEWNCIYKSDHSTGETCYSKNSNMCAEPCPRYAHQLGETSKKYFI
jgi:muskelin